MNAGLGDIPVAEMESIYYVWWPLATIAMIVLMSFISLLGTIIVVFVKRVLAKLDHVVNVVNGIKVDEARLETELHDHLKDEGKHCKQGNCVRMMPNGTS